MAIGRGAPNVSQPDPPEARGGVQGVRRVLRPYQSVGVEWLLGGRVRGLADEAGLGKTVQAVAALEAAGAGSALVVCPAAVVPVWERHLREWAPGVQATVQSYDRIRLRGLPRVPEVVILDEAHYLKNPAAARTRALYGPRGNDSPILRRAERVWLLTATPAPNHPGELFTHMKAARLVDGDYNSFLRRYCRVRQTTYGPQVLGLRSSTMPELLALVRRLFLRRRVREVLPDLPQWEWYDLPLSPAEDSNVIDKLAQELPSLREWRAAVEAGTADEDLVAMLERAVPHTATLRRMIGILKCPAIVEWAANYLSGSESKLLIWAVHHDVINAIHDGLSGFGVVQMTGATPHPRREAIVHEFQHDPSVRVLIGQINAGGVGLTLTAAHTVLFAEASWCPADLYQAAKRAHRIGQDSPVSVYVSQVAGTIDEAIMRVLARKARLITGVL